MLLARSPSCWLFSFVMPAGLRVSRRPSCPPAFVLPDLVLAARCSSCFPSCCPPPSCCSTSLAVDGPLLPRYQLSLSSCCPLRFVLPTVLRAFRHPSCCPLYLVLPAVSQPLMAHFSRPARSPSPSSFVPRAAFRAGRLPLCCPLFPPTSLSA